MNHKNILQIFLILLVLFLITFFYYNYFYKKDNNLALKQDEITSADILKSVDGSTINEILYESYDNDGNKFIIKSKSGTFDEKKKDEINMMNVEARVNLADGTSIILVSDSAEYNSSNSNTKFIKNVKLKYLNHRINSDNIDLTFTESKLEAYNNLIYRNSDINLSADKVDLDLLTKNTKIFMFDNSSVKIIKEYNGNN
jgi:lipopolysaccharide assembly outer membrane protein LptD (OstA)